jgi:hypothetical protein
MLDEKRKYEKMIGISHKEKKKERCMLMHFLRNLQAFNTLIQYQPMTLEFISTNELFCCNFGDFLSLKS